MDGCANIYLSFSCLYVAITNGTLAIHILHCFNSMLLRLVLTGSQHLATTLTNTFNRMNKMIVCFNVLLLFYLSSFYLVVSGNRNDRNKALGTPEEKITYQPLTTEFMLADAYPHPPPVPRISSFTF
jgi:hypothetical protein